MLDRQETEVRSHHRLSSRRATIATCPVQAYIPTRYAFSSTSVCMELPHRTSSSNVHRLRSTLLGADYGLLLTMTLYIRGQTWYAMVSVVSASSVQKLETNFHHSLETRRWALLTFVEDLKLCCLTERVMRLSAHSWWTWLIRVGVISIQTYLLTGIWTAAVKGLSTFSVRPHNLFMVMQSENSYHLSVSPVSATHAYVWDS